MKTPTPEKTNPEKTEISYQWYIEPRSAHLNAEITNPEHGDPEKSPKTIHCLLNNGKVEERIAYAITYDEASTYHSNRKDYHFALYCSNGLVCREVDHNLPKLTNPFEDPDQLSRGAVIKGRSLARRDQRHSRLIRKRSVASK